MKKMKMAIFNEIESLKMEREPIWRLSEYNSHDADDDGLVVSTDQQKKAIST